MNEKIQMSKKYQTEDGRSVRLLCIDGPTKSRPVIGLIECESAIYTWSDTGDWTHNSALNLIKAPEFIQIQRWLNIYSDDTITIHKSKLQAEASVDEEDNTLLAIAVPFSWDNGARKT